MVDLTDIVTMLRKTDAFHDPSEANALLTAAADEIARLRSSAGLSDNPARLPMGPYWHPGDRS
jgi:hypothetical protein